MYSYIAASFFRLFTKPEGYYVRSWSSIINGFSRFYGETVNVRVPPPTEDALQFFKYRLDDITAKVTLYRFMYMSNSDASFLSLKSFLYDDCLSYSGMHIVSIVMQLSEALNCSMELIVDAFKSKEMENQVECLVRVLGFLNGNDENYRRRMWRYGRVFDQQFMCDLQTKSCPKLVYILAEALRSEEPEKHKGILQIAQLASVTEDNKRKFATMGQRLLETLKSHKPQGASSSTSGPCSSRN